MKAVCSFLLVLCTILFPLLGYAQQGKLGATPRFYVGAQALQSNYEIFYPTTPSLLTVRPWQLTAGIQLKPRWYVQLGYAYSSHTSREDPSYTGTTLSGQYVSGNRGSDSWAQVIPLLVRYALIQHLQPRLQLDVIAGGSLVSAGFSSYGTDFVDGQIVRETHREDHATQSVFTAGLGARYPFKRHFEGVLDWTYSRNLKSVPESLHQAVTGNKWGLTRALSLGLRYRFAIKKKAGALAGT